MGRSSVGREQWLSWVAEQAASGLSVKEFCEQRQLSLQSFYNWRRKAAEKPDAAVAGFVPVSIKGHAIKELGTLLEIELPCGAKLKVPEADESLRQVLRVLLELGRRG